ncbi:MULTISPECIES: FecCD family ABC transporter permease [Microbacterium]|uniref:ABC transporter permease n=1 Tax=Microbacterium testaceum TaxID=2033 RepID=A0A4Y3QPC9_MICTE|nr:MULTISPECIES: iron ABC transporter permease [Microbacterium]MDZ5143846.1 iron ABC transporter permease [Microbacterium testaceum]PNW08788.1 iron ABC transporter permease [Microbacterium testaceum]REC96811.1 iron complex transport system permease protein [Microbacterium sp. AG157]WJS92270.1 iron ABC transporter permease [Microbacterium testaceum]GEB47001.1 ABC transporter permease [Microbacterium testaceum]
MSTLAPALSAPGDARPRHWGRRRAVGVIALVVVLVVAAILSVTFGARDVTAADIWSGLTGSTDTASAAAVAKRVPRTVLAILVGAALAVSGAVLQGATRNPLADPQILGINGGAGLAIVVGIAFFGLGSATSYIWVGLIGAAGAAVLVYAIGSLGRGGATPLRLALAGAVSAVAFSSLTSAVLLPRVNVMNEFRFWQIGGVGGATFETILQVLPFLLAGLLICLASSTALNTLALGDELAAGLGARVRAARLISTGGAVILCGAATAVAGPIGFVGLVVPHMVRLLVGVDHRWLLPVSALGGAVLLTLGDVVGRVVARPEEIEVGIVTALVGAPFFIALVRRQRMRAL